MPETNDETVEDFIAELRAIAAQIPNVDPASEITLVARGDSYGARFSLAFGAVADGPLAASRNLLDFESSRDALRAMRPIFDCRGHTRI